MSTIAVHSGFRPNRILSRPLSVLFLQTPIRPNHITVLSAACGVVAGMLFSQGTYFSGLWGAAFYELAVVLDNCDGEVARAKNLKSPIGAWLDIFADFSTDLALFAGLAMGLYQNHPELPALALGIACGVGAALHLCLVVLEKLKGFGPAAFEAANPDQIHRQNRLWDLFDGLREGEASWFVVVFAALGHTDWLLYAGAFYMQALWLSALILNFRWIARKR